MIVAGLWLVSGWSLAGLWLVSGWSLAGDKKKVVFDGDSLNLSSPQPQTSHYTESEAMRTHDSVMIPEDR